MSRRIIGTTVIGSFAFRGSRHSTYRHYRHDGSLGWNCQAGKKLVAEKVLGNTKPLGSTKNSLGSNKLPGSNKLRKRSEPPAVMLSVTDGGTTVEAVNMSKGGVTARPNRISVVAHS